MRKPGRSVHCARCWPRAMSTLLSIAQPVLLTLAGVGLPAAAHALNRRFRLNAVMPTIRRAFLVLDPLLNEHIKSYGPSDVRFAIELVTALLADGALLPSEVRYAAAEIQKRYRPDVAAGKTVLYLKPDSVEQKVYNAVEEAIQKGLFRGSDPISAARSLFSVIR